MAERRKVVAFVRQKSFRRENTIIAFIEKLLPDYTTIYVDVVYEVAYLVEHGPLEWFGADEERYGPDKASEMQLMYRYSKEKDRAWKKRRSQQTKSACS